MVLSFGAITTQVMFHDTVKVKCPVSKQILIW